MAQVTCPQCGDAMRATPAADKRRMVKELVQGGSSAHYAQNFADQHHEKEAALGVVHVCTGCPYTMRVPRAPAPRQERSP